MKNIKIISLLIVLISILSISNICYAKDLNQILNYVVEVEPQRNNGTLKIIYEFTWKVLDSTKEGPIKQLKIDTPNEEYHILEVLSDNIESIEKNEEAYVTINFKEAYEKDDVFTFKYSINQAYMYKLEYDDSVKYRFTPAQFKDVDIDNLIIKWHADGIKKCDSDEKQNDYYIWTKKNLKNGAKLTVNVEYDETEFDYLYNNMQVGKNKNQGINNGIIITVIVFLLAGVSLVESNNYGSHRGFFGGLGSGDGAGGCACACARSCACACAGSGRAGCSKKDFYGTKLDAKKIEKVIN